MIKWFDSFYFLTFILWKWWVLIVIEIYFEWNDNLTKIKFKITKFKGSKSEKMTIKTLKIYKSESLSLRFDIQPIFWIKKSKKRTFCFHQFSCLIWETYCSTPKDFALSSVTAWLAQFLISTWPSAHPNYFLRF